MVQYLIHCVACQHEIVAGSRSDVPLIAVDHLRNVHQNVTFPSPGLDFFRVYEFRTLDYPGRGESLVPGVPSQALTVRKPPTDPQGLTVPDASDLTM